MIRWNGAVFAAVVVMLSLGFASEASAQAGGSGKVAGAQPNDGAEYTRLGTSLLQVGKFDEAVAAFEKGVALSPNSAEAHHYLAHGLFARAVHSRFIGSVDGSEVTRQFDAAITEYRKTILLKPGLAKAHSDLGQTLQLVGRMDEALIEYRNAAALQPTDYSAREVVALCLEGMGKFDESIEEYRKALVLNPKSATALSRIGQDLILEGRYGEAITEFQKAVAMFPSSASLFELGGALLQNGNYDEAIVQFRGAITADPNNAYTHYALALALEKKGQNQEAEQQFAEAYRLDPKLQSRPKFEWGASGFAIYHW